MTDKAQDILDNIDAGVKAGTEKAASQKLKLDLVKGVEGNCIVLNQYRIAGHKPWGGGKVIQSWTVDREDIERALEEMPKPRNVNALIK